MTGVQELQTALFHAHVSRCTSYAGVCVLAYDHLLTFSEEVRLIWKRPKSIVSYLFLINRYVTPLILAVDVYDKGGLTEKLNGNFCKIWFVAEGYMNFLLLAAVHALMVMRVGALYGNRRHVQYFLCTTYALYFLATFSILTPGMFQAVKTFYPEDKFLHVCWGKLTDYFWLTWVPALILESLVFALTAFKAWTHVQESMHVPIARTLYRDGFQYFIVILLCSLFPLLVWTKAPSTLDAMPKYAGMAIVNVMAFRLVLNLRRHSIDGTTMPTLEVYEMPNSTSGKSGQPYGVRHTQTIGSDPVRRLGKSDLTLGDMGSCLNLDHECWLKEGAVAAEGDKYTSHVRVSHSQRRPSGFEVDLEHAQTPVSWRGWLSSGRISSRF